MTTSGMTGNSNYSMNRLNKNSMNSEWKEVDKHLRPPISVSEEQKELINFLENKGFGRVEKFEKYLNEKTGREVLIIFL